MFHTKIGDGPTTRRGSVVIPWRGFRCFTRQRSAPEEASNGHHVVIPWRGFRCFTLTTVLPHQDGAGKSLSAVGASQFRGEL